MKKKRLLTKSDFDGIVCAALLKNANLIDDVTFVHGFDVKNGAVEIFDEDITCNLPYSPKAKLNFRYGEIPSGENQITNHSAKSCARVVYEYLSDAKYNKPDLVSRLISAVDKAQSGDFTTEEVLDPKGWDMLSFIMDSRTAIGKMRAFRMSNYALMVSLVDLLLNKEPEDILAIPDVVERLEYYKDSAIEYMEMLKRAAVEDEGVLIIDLRNEPYHYPANRFIKYAVFPDAMVSIQVMWGLRQRNTVLGIGKSIFTKPKNFDLSKVIEKMGGLGHKNAGSIQVENGIANEVIKELTDTLKDNIRGV